MLSWLWLAITNNFLWLVLPEDVGMSLAAFCLTTVLVFTLILESSDSGGATPYMPKKQRPPKSLWMKSLIKAMNWCTSAMTKIINNLRVRCRYRPQHHHTCGHCHQQKKPRHAPFTTTTCMTSTWPSGWTTIQAPNKQFDSDSQTLMLNNGASACITNCMDDFIESPKQVDRKVKGINSHANATHRGTLKWHVDDDSGLVHIMVIRGVYLIPDAAIRILSRQHLAQQADDHYPRDEGTSALTTSKNITLFWSQRRFTKTVPLDLRTNVGLTTTASGARSYCAFCATIEAAGTTHPNIFTMLVIPDEEDANSFQPRDLVEQPAPEEDDQETMPEQSDEFTGTGPITALMDLSPISHVIPEDPEPTSLDPHDKLLRWHYCLGHLSFDRIMQLAQKGQLPKRLLASKKPFCATCQYGKMTRRLGVSRKTTRMQQKQQHGQERLCQWTN